MLMPTPSHTEAEVINAVMGKESETAVSAFSLSCATKALSIRLYEYCKNMENTGGSDIFTISLGMGIVPIKFS